MHSIRPFANLTRRFYDNSKRLAYINVCGANVRTALHQRQSHCAYSSGADDGSNAEKTPPKSATLPALMKVPLSHLLSGLPLYQPFGWIARNFVIGQIEPDFDPVEFECGAREALVVASNHLANREFDQLQDLISPHALRSLKFNVERMTEEQRQQISISRDDTIEVFPYQAGIITNAIGESFLEITVIFWVQKKREPNSIQIFGIDKNTKFCYCSFVSELEDANADDFMNGDENDDDVELDWTIRRVNCIKIADLFKPFVNKF